MISIYFLPTIDCQELISVIDKEAAATPGCSLGCMRGPAWASLKLPAQEWRLPALTALDNLLRFHENVSEDEQVDWWFTKLFTGGEILEHDHTDAVLSGVFYPQAAKISFEPGRNVMEFPKGSLVCFPASRAHRVFPAHEVRYSLSFNIYASS